MTTVHTLIGLKRLADAKQRMMPELDSGQRRALMIAMLASVVSAARAARLGPVLLATSEPSADRLGERFGVTVVSDGGLPWNDGLLHALDQIRPVPPAVLYLAGDLPLLTAAELHEFCAAAPPRGMAVGRARDGGSNALLVRPPHLARPLFGRHQSSTAHRAQAAARGLDCAVLDIPGMGLDVDTVTDLGDAGMAVPSINETGQGSAREPGRVQIPPPPR